MFIKTLSAKQLESFQDSNAKINIWEGAVRSGKTYVSLVRFLDEVANGPIGNYVILTRTYDTFRRNVLQLLEELCGLDVRYYSGKREMVLWGRPIFVVGADDERAEAKIRGPTFAGAYVDEISLIPHSVFKMLISRCAMKGARIFGTTNPDSPYHWLKTDYLNDKNCDVMSWQFTLLDNPELKKDEQEYLKRQYKGVWYKRFILGQWVQAEGAIYDFFDEKIHCIDFAPSNAEYYVCGVDYGTSNPTSFVLLGVNRDKFPNMWIEKVFYYDSKTHQRQKTDSEYADDLKKFVQHKNVQAIYVDPSAASFKAELNKSGMDNIFDAQNEVLDGIRFVGDMLNNGTMKICRSCRPLIEEFQSYIWDAKSAKTGIDKPVKENDHALDALRYCVYTHFFNKGDEKIDWGKAYRDAYQIPKEIPRFFSDPI